MQRVTQSIGLGLVLLTAGACGAANIIGPENNLEVNNATDTFQWQATALENVTQTLTYTWQNTGSTANVNQSASVTDGTAQLVIFDGSEDQVYSRDLSATGTFAANGSSSGSWRIEVRLSGVTGTINFRVQKP